MNSGNKGQMITRARALDIIDAYGANELHWPLAERQALAELARQCEVVKAALVQAGALDQLIVQASPDIAIGPLKARVLAAVGQQRQSFGARLARMLGFSAARTGAAIWQPLGIMACSAAMGLVVGTLLVEPQAMAATSIDNAIDMAVADLGDSAVEGLE